MTLPGVVPNWAMNNVVDPISGQPNVVTPPIEKQDNGWAFGEFPPRQWFNWLGRNTAERLQGLSDLADLNITTNGNGVGLFPTDDAMITIMAIDKTTPARYLFALGYKAAGVAPVFNVIDSATLTLGVGTITGDQPISGGTAANIVVYGTSIPAP